MFKRQVVGVVLAATVGVIALGAPMRAQADNPPTYFVWVATLGDGTALGGSSPTYEAAVQLAELGLNLSPEDKAEVESQIAQQATAVGMAVTVATPAADPVQPDMASSPAPEMQAAN